jgi:hypothetical protein
MSAPGLGDPQEWRWSYEHPRGAREAHCEVPTTGRSRHLADDGRYFTDPAARFAEIFVGIVNAARGDIQRRPTNRADRESQNQELGSSDRLGC